ncbi:MAG: MotA/TolQ/ExbB proton channel family protein [Myxococcales bacterium]|nr:MotA/TolQ/ExbB proton channel family protein [Myxococcales bacterium]
MDTSPQYQVDAPRTAARLLGAWTRLLPVLVALVGTAVTLFVASLLPADSRAHELLLARGWTQPLTLTLFFWGTGHALRRFIVQAGESRALWRCELLISGGRLQRDHVAPVMDSLDGLGDSLAAPVLQDVLAYFRGNRPARDEVLKVANQAINRAYDRVEDDYRSLNAVMWLLPLSGFLGTVVGMAAAIQAFDGVLGQVRNDLSALAPSVAGLATAFDTTLLALVLVVPLKLIEVGLAGRDRRILEHIDRTLGTGLVRSLDLAGLAQQTPAEAALDRYSRTVERIEGSLKEIDLALVSITGQLKTMPNVAGSLAEITDSARAARQAMPQIVMQLEELRSQGDRPIVISRGGGRPEPPR